MRQKLRRRRGDSDDSEQREPAGTAGKTAASGADRALTAGVPERGSADSERAGPADAADRTARGADSSGRAAGGADRIWHSPAAGLPTPVANDAGNRSGQEETGEPSKPAAKGTYRVLTEEVAARSRSATGGTDGTSPGDGTAALAGDGDGGTGRSEAAETAALSTSGTEGGERARSDQSAALSRPGVSSREPRPAVGDIAGRAGRAAGAGTTAGDGASSARGDAARQGNGAAGMLGTASGGSHEPLLVDAAALRASWQRVQGDFVDDPRAAVSNAADLVEHTAQALVGALRQRQLELRALWDETLGGDAGEARDGAWLAKGRAGGDRPWHRVSQARAGRLSGWLGRGRVRGAGPGGERLEDAAMADGDHPVADGPPVAGASPEAAGGTQAADITEQLRLVMQRYRALFNQICRS